MLWGAPLSFALQARPVKLLLKQLFFLCLHPPGIVLSLLPAPQQALLSMDDAASYKVLYQTEEERLKEEKESTQRSPPKTAAKEMEENDSDSEDEQIELDASEYDSEDDDDEGYDDDSADEDED